MVNGKNSKKAGMNLVTRAVEVRNDLSRSGSDLSNHTGSSSDAKASPTEKITGLNEVFQKTNHNREALTLYKMLQGCI
jgi:hypothetical protein